MSVFHVKYRPQVLSQLDLPDVAQILEKMFSGESFPRAVLFAGPKGSGKTSAARIVARLVNGINSGEEKGVLDIVEMDAATNRGIDEARMLRDQAYLLPTQLKNKVFIIDEVHMMTRDAFNALLKLLEEPPAYTMFILCTTNPENLPETVRSRLVQVDFRKAGKSEIISSLKKIVEEEKIEVEESVLDMCYEGSDGSFRNAVRLLNEIVLNLGKKIDTNKAKSYLSKVLVEYKFEEMARDLVAGEYKKINLEIEKMALSGVEMDIYMQKLVEWFSGQMWADKPIIEGNLLKKWLANLLVACRNIKDSPLPQLPLQLAVWETVGEKVQTKSVGAAVLPQAVVEIKEQPKISEVSDEIKVECGDEFETLKNSWLRILAEIKAINVTVEAFLRSANPMSLGSGILIVEVFYKFHKDRLEDNKNLRLIETCVARSVGRNLQVKFVLAEKKSNLDTLNLVVTPVQPPEKISSEIAGNGDSSKDDLYLAAKEIFG